VRGTIATYIPAHTSRSKHLATFVISHQTKKLPAISTTNMSFTSAVRPFTLRRAAVTISRTPRRNARVVNAFSRFFQTRVEPRVVAKYREKLELKQKTSATWDPDGGRTRADV